MKENNEKNQTQAEDNIKEQKKMYLQFENEFGKGINDWKEKSSKE